MKRRNRLSRSRDFDSVYRHGQSVSSRYLVLYTFPRPGHDATGDPRLGLAASRHVGSAVERNRIKRRLRAAFEAAGADLRPGYDYVLIVKPGLVEAAETRGFPWLLECVREVLGQAAGSAAVST
jgi:ribonuclease P protein component